MPFCLRQWSLIPRDCPQFRVQDRPDGPTQVFDPRDLKKVSLTACFPLHSNSVPASDCVPSKANCESRHKTLPDIFNIEGRLCVSEKMRALIENGDAEKHQFFPVELFDVKGQVFIGAYFIPNILTMQDSLIFEKSNLEMMQSSATRSFVVSGSRGCPDWRTHASERLADHQIWREKIISSEIYFSDRVGEHMVRERLRGFSKDDLFKTNVI